VRPLPAGYAPGMTTADESPEHTDELALPEGATKEWFDAQYDVGALVPEGDAILAAWHEESRAVRREFPPVELRYGGDERQVVDVFRGPDTPRAAPLVVFVHGGYWQALERETFAFLAPPFLEQGAVFATVEYRLAPEVSVPDVVADVRAGLAELAGRAEELGADPRRITVIGHSAGGHLIAELMATDWAAHGLPDDTVGAGLGISGLYDLEPIRRSYLNDVLGMSAEVAHDASPVHTAPTATGPLLVTCGGDEPGEFDRQQHLLARSWPGLPVTILDQPDGTHFDACDRLTRPGPLRDAALALLRDRAAT
jgi:arylformamidase